MATSGSYAFDPTFAGLFDEACERAGVDPRTEVAEKIHSAKMSLNLMFAEWVVKDGDALYRNTTETETVTAGTSTLALADGTFDVISDDLVIAYPSNGNQTPLARMSREDYLRIPTKTQAGRPAQFYVDRSTLNQPTIVFWPVPDRDITVTYDAMRKVQTVRALGETFDVEFLWLEAVAAGLANRLAKKWNPSRVPITQPDADEAYKVARRAGAGASQVTITCRGFGASARTRRR